jgi:anti-repressor protein
MEELINVNFDRQTVSARELWERLDRPYRDFVPWFNRYKEYGFIEGQDYRALTIKVVTAQGNEVEAQDYEISLDMAKELAMLQRTEKGKEIRLYLLEIEKQWNNPEAIMARALKIANDTIAMLKPKAEFFDAVAGSKTAISMGEAAKIIYEETHLGRNKLFKVLRQKGILMSDNIPYQEFIDRGYFRTIEQKYTVPDGSTRISIKTLVYQKGLDFIRKVIKEDNIIALKQA